MFADEIEGDHELVDLPSTVLYVPGSAAQRLAGRDDRRVPSPPNRFQVAVTTPATVKTTLRRGGRVVARAEQRLPAGVDRTIAPPAVPAGPYRIELRAVTADGRADARSDTAYLGSQLTMRWGRRFAGHYQRVEDRHPGVTVGGRCRRSPHGAWTASSSNPARPDAAAPSPSRSTAGRQAWLVARPYRCSPRTREHLRRHPHYLRFAP